LDKKLRSLSSVVGPYEQPAGTTTPPSRSTFTYDLADNRQAHGEPRHRRPAGHLRLPIQPGDGVVLREVRIAIVTYTYGAALQRQSPPALIGNVVGRITHIAGTEDRLYGPLGEIVSETRAIPIQGGQVNTYTTTFTYDTWNRIQQMVYPDTPGEPLKYTYDFGGLPYRVHGNDDRWRPTTR
jgi:YD repeat-containing protein